MPRRHTPIELLRFVLSLSVVAYHYFYFGPSIAAVPGTPVVTAVPFLLLAVETFFIVSGFVIMFSASGRSGAEFAVARFARLGPTLFACSTLTYLVLGLFPLHYGAPALNQWAASVLVLPLAVHDGVDASLWSLKYEIVFYVLIFAVLSAGLTRRRITWLAWGLVVSDLLFAAGGTGGGPSWWPMGHYGAFFALGMLYYLRSSGAKGLAPIWLAAGAMALVDCRLELWRVEAQLLGHGMPALATSILAGAVAIGAFFGFAGAPEIPVLARAFTLLGSASYPLYVVHQFLGYRIITWACGATGLGPTLVKLGVMGFMVSFALAFTVLIERPLMDEYWWFGRRLARILHPAAAEQPR
ncbi:MAG TPA: acyltransferase [Stellaceae bacterium]|nr:acyltransferase [Stellaceae bacterium]